MESMKKIFFLCRSQCNGCVWQRGSEMVGRIGCIVSSLGRWKQEGVYAYSTQKVEWYKAQPRLPNSVYLRKTMKSTFLWLCVNQKIQQKCCARDATMQLSTCNMVAARVPQGNRRNETSMQLVGG